MSPPFPSVSLARRSPCAASCGDFWCTVCFFGLPALLELGLQQLGLPPLFENFVQLLYANSDEVPVSDDVFVWGFIVGL